MSTVKHARRGIRAKIPTTIPADLAPMDDEAAPVDVGECQQGEDNADFEENPRVIDGLDAGERREGQGQNLLGRKKAVSGTDDPPLFFFPETCGLNDVHHVHHVHHPDAGDILTAATDPGAEDLAQAVALIEDVIRRCNDEPALLASDDFEGAVKLVREQDQGEWVRLRVALKKAKPSGVLLGEIDKATRPESEGGEETSTADDLVALVRERAELFHSEDGTCFAVIKEPPRKTLNLDTKAFSEWLGFAYYESTESEKGPGRAASETAIRTARMVLAGIAKHIGQEHPAYLRVARHQDAYYLDLGGEDWRAVEIMATGWRVVDQPPVHFWRASTVRPLPLPVPGGTLALLWQYANVPAKVRPLVVACLLEWLRPETPFPILELVGEQGSAKSNTQDKLRRCVDPNSVGLRAAPKSVEDLFVSAGCNWVTSLNNLSRLSAQQQDALCNLATGGGFAGRTLYTNMDETVIEAKRPVILNGIVPVVTAQDLTDRVVHIELPEIQTYRAEREINEAFDRDWPLILGGLLDLFVMTLSELPNARLERPPRMMDFALLGEAMTLAQSGAPGDFMALYAENRRDSVARSLEASPVAMAIRKIADAHQYPNLPFFDGLMQALLTTLEGHRDGAGAWPKSARGLGDVLRRQRPALNQIGITVEISKPGKHGVNVTIRKKGEHGERHSASKPRLAWDA
jgi:hypothetical protein